MVNCYISLLILRSDVGRQSPSKLTAGFVSELAIPLTITNAGRDAYAAKLEFTLPSERLAFIRIDPLEVSCTIIQIYK